MTQFSLTLEERRFLCDTARLAIMRGLRGGGRDVELPTPPEGVLHSLGSCFVTLHAAQAETPQLHLRGCIGSMQAYEPLYTNVGHMAYAAAFEDPRFPPLRAEELDDIFLEISVLGPLEACPDPGSIEIGRHGLLLQLGRSSGVFLPQVPVEQGWDRGAYLENLCRKAGLAAGSWKHPEARLFWFECLVFQCE